MKHRWLHYVHILMQHTIQECTLYVNVLRLKIPHNADGQKSTQCCISPNWSPSLKEINSVDMFKTLSNISGLETLDLITGPTSVFSMLIVRVWMEHVGGKCFTELQTVHASTRIRQCFVFPKIAPHSLLRPSWVERASENSTTDRSHCFMTMTKTIEHQVCVCCVFRNWRAAHRC